MHADEISNRLPPLRDDEPATLRQNIVDEILDHMHVSLRRELLVNGGDEAGARQRVLDKFGNPQEIARRLWFQAMRSRIMTQRIAIGTSVFSVLVCVALVGMMGSLMREQQQANAALLERMATLIPAGVQPPSVRMPQKSLLQIRIEPDTADGVSLEKYSASVQRLPDIEHPAASGVLSLSFDQAGVANCGYTEPGRFRATITTPWHERVVVDFDVQKDQDHLESITVPGRIAELTKVIFRIDDLPPELADKSIGLVMRLRPRGERIVADRHWKPNGWRWPVPMPMAFFTSDLGLLTTLEPDPAGSPPFYPNEWNLSLADSIEQREWIGGDRVYVGPALGTSVATFKTSCEWSIPAGEYAAEFGMTNLSDSPAPSGWPNSGPNLYPKKHEFWLPPKGPVFTAMSGKLNEWTIRIPEHVKLCLSDPSKIP